MDDPALAVGSAKELIESTAKIVLTERGCGVDDKADLPVLVRDAQRALGLHPSATTPGPDGSDAVKRILGAASSLAMGVAELRNRGFGTGHGPAGARVGLRAVTPTSPSTQLSPDASSCSTPSPTWKHRGGSTRLDQAALRARATASAA